MPDNPGLPSWDVPLVVTLSAERYGLDSLVSRPGAIQESGNGIDTSLGGTLQFVYTDSIPEKKVGDQFVFNPEQEISYINSTDTLFVEPNEQRSESIPLGDLLDVPFNDGDTVPLDTIFIPASSQVIELEQFDSLRVVHVVTPNGGSLGMTLNNDTEFFWNEIQIQVLLDEPGNPSLGAAVFQNVQPRETVTTSIDLSGDSLKQNLMLRVEGNGPDQGMVQLFHSDALTFTVSVTQISCDFAEAIIRRQEPIFSSNDLVLDQDDWISSAQIDSGFLYFEIENQTDVEDSIYLDFLDFFDTETNDTLKLAFHFGRANSSENPWVLVDSINLAGKELRLPLPSADGEPQRLHARTKSVILSSGEDLDGNPRFARIAVQDSVITRFYTGAIKFGRIEGVPKDVTVEIEPQSQPIDIWNQQPDIQADLAGSLLLEDASFVVSLGNSIDFPARLILDFTAVNSRADPPIRTEKTYDFWLAPSQDELVIPDVEELINVLPDTILFEGRVLVGRDHLVGGPFDPYEPHGISPEDSVVGEINLTAPFQLRITRSTPVRPAPIQMQETFEADITEITLLAEIKNTVPLGGTVYLLAGRFDDEATARDSLVAANVGTYGVMTPLHIPLPQLDPNTGRALSPALDTLRATITGEGVSIFSQEGVWVRQILWLDPTLDSNGNPVAVAVHQDDFIEVGITAEAVYRFNEGD